MDAVFQTRGVGVKAETLNGPGKIMAVIVAKRAEGSGSKVHHNPQMRCQW
jgi:hypothetical protein|tara:strand:- start:13201 stop:13350 length:150 start_codon:yes stop_codon:yes gene_type:complete